MKKITLMLGALLIAGATFAGDGNKKACCKKEGSKKECCKKGEKKSCDKDAKETSEKKAS